MAVGEGRVPEGTQEGELLGAGQRGDLFGVEAGGAEQVEDRGGALLEAGEVVAETGGRVGPPGGEPLPDLDGHRPRGHAQDRAEGVGPVAAEEEGPLTRARGGEGGGGGKGRTTAAAGTGDQEGAHGSER